MNHSVRNFVIRLNGYLGLVLLMLAVAVVLHWHANGAASDEVRDAWGLLLFIGGILLVHLAWHSGAALFAGRARAAPSAAIVAGMLALVLVFTISWNVIPSVWRVLVYVICAGLMQRWLVPWIKRWMIGDAKADKPAE